VCFDIVLSFTPLSIVTQHPAPTAKPIGRNGASDLLLPDPSISVSAMSSSASDGSARPIKQP